MIDRDPMPQKTNFDFPATLQAWKDIARGAALPLGIPVAELIERAKNLARRLDNEPIRSIAEDLLADPDAADLMHALQQELGGAGNSADERLFNRVCRAYELAALLTWEDEIDEGSELRGQLALIAWRHCRRFRAYREARAWEARCFDEALAQSHIRDFLSLPGADRSDDLARRYFVDPLVVLAFSKRLESERNQNFNWALTESAAAFGCLERLGLPEEQEERAFLMASLALSASAGCRHGGLLRDAQVWLEIAKQKLRLVVGARPFRAVVDFAELALRNDYHDASSVRERYQRVRQELVECDVERHVVYADMLHGENLKAAGLLVEASHAFRRVVDSPIAADDPLARGLASTSLAEIASKLGQELDVNGYRSAQSIFERHGLEWPMALLQSSVGECLRYLGRFEDAIVAYRDSIDRYRSVGMKSKIAYVQLLLAEVLLVSGRRSEMATAIAEGLRIAQEEGIATDARAAAALLYRAQLGGDDQHSLKVRLQAFRQALGAYRR